MPVPSLSFHHAGALFSFLLTMAGCAASSRAAPAQPGSAALYLPGRSEPQVVRFLVDRGEAVMGGDIRLGPVERLLQSYAAPGARGGMSGVQGIVTIDGDSRLWDGGVIPYEIDGAVNNGVRGEIAAAISELDQRTRLTIRPRTPMDRDYIVFNTQNSPDACDSYLGKSGGAQPVRVNGCGRSEIMHEILHAAGFDHEHQRADRDSFVTILWENVEPGNRTWLERIDQDRTPRSAYDHHSIMHYRSQAFSRNGRPTIVSRVPGVDVRGVENLSLSDIQAIDRVYAGEPDAGGGLAPIFGGLGIPMPGGWPPAQLPIPGGHGAPPSLPGGGASVPGLPQWGLPDPSSLPLPWPR